MSEPSAARTAPKQAPARRRSRIGPFVGFVFFPVFSMLYIHWLSKPENRAVIHDILVSIGLATNSQPAPARLDPIFEIERKLEEARAVLREARENRNDPSLLDEAERKAKEAISIAERWKTHPAYRDRDGAKRRLDREIQDIRQGLLRFIRMQKPLFPPDRFPSPPAGPPGEPPTAPPPLPADAI